MSSTTPIKISFDALSGVDGSARFSFGDTTALASVSGPVTARLAAEHPARATVEVHVRPLSSIPGTTEKHIRTALKGILERACILAHHPRTLIQVVVQALSPPSPTDAHAHAHAHALLLAAEINACSLALLNAGSIPMRGIVCAVHVSRRTSGRRVESVLGWEGDSEGGGCFAFLFGADQVGTEGDIPPSKLVWTNYCASSGSSLSLGELSQAEKVASEGAAAVWIKMKESLRGFSSTSGDSDMET